QLPESPEAEMPQQLRSERIVAVARELRSAERVEPARLLDPMRDVGERFGFGRGDADAQVIGYALANCGVRPRLHGEMVRDGLAHCRCEPRPGAWRCVVEPHDELGGLPDTRPSGLVLPPERLHDDFIREAVLDLHVVGRLVAWLDPDVGETGRVAQGVLVL